MPSVGINYLAVLVAGVLSMALGAFWYSPAAFGKLWMTLSGLTEASMEQAKKKGMTKLYTIAFIGSLVMSYVLAHFVDYAEATTVSEGLQTGFWVWLGFMATKTLGTVLWENKPVKLYILNTTYDLVSALIAGSILAVWV